MKYALVPLAPADANQVSEFLVKLAGRGVQVLYADYAPHAWIISYNGTPRQLADILWPDDSPEDEHIMDTGMVVRIPNSANFNGLASRSFWDLITGSDNASTA